MEKRPISLKEFANSLPIGAVNTVGAGRYVFGNRAIDTVPYLVEEGASAIVYPDEVKNIPITLQSFAFTFDLSNKEQAYQYNILLNAIHSRWYILRHIERHFDKEKKNMVIYIEVSEQHRKIEVTNIYDHYMAKLENKEPSRIPQ